jgi:hypothetical protein
MKWRYMWVIGLLCVFMYYFNSLRKNLQRDTEDVDEVFIIFEWLVLVKSIFGSTFKMLWFL